jgi:hypothetical protein
MTPPAHSRSICLSSGASTHSGCRAQAGLRPGTAHRRVVAMADGSILNRYWDDRDTPRDESYREDIELARQRAPGAAGVPRYSSRGRERLGLRLPLVRRSAYTRHDRYHRHRADRSQQPAVRAGECDSARLRAASRPRLRRRICAPRGGAACRHRPISVGRLRRRLSRLSVDAAMRPSRDSRLPCSIRCSSDSPPSPRRPRWRRPLRRELAQGGRHRDDPARHRTTVGCAQRLGAHPVDRDLRTAPVPPELAGRKQSRVAG